MACVYVIEKEFVGVSSAFCEEDLGPAAARRSLGLPFLTGLGCRDGFSAGDVIG